MRPRRLRHGPFYVVRSQRPGDRARLSLPGAKGTVPLRFMKKESITLALLSVLALLAPATSVAADGQVHAAGSSARQVTISRDDWGIAHVKGATDADAVFGAMYAQAEDDFPRIEQNLLTALGRLAEAEGEDAVWQDLRQRLWIDDAMLKRDYARSPAWLRTLMQAWAAGLNHYLATHPEERPRVLTHFEPWMALSFTEGSIGGDIEKASLKRLAAFYGSGAAVAPLAMDRLRDGEPRGSNGIAIGGRKSLSGHPQLLINPHTSLFFRSELAMESGQGLHAYGAATWGQFFIYQGFNEHLGWMHTTSGADNVDEFAESVEQRGGRWVHLVGKQWRPLISRKVAVRYRNSDGSMTTRSFTTFATHHGPIVGAAGDRWIALSLMNRPIAALSQSWLRTKARSQREYLTALAFEANSSNNTLYADRDGNIALLMPQFAPRRSAQFDYRDPVDGSNPLADWRGLHVFGDAPKVLNPAAGWIYNSNDAPWRASGEGTLDPARFAATYDQVGANPRGDHAISLLSRPGKLSLETLHALAYDPHLPLFDDLIDGLGAGRVPAHLAGPVALLRRWDRNWAADSTAMTLANYWGDELESAVRARMPAHANVFAEMRASSDAVRLSALGRAVDRMTSDWGSWQVPWGEVNRYQRTSPAIVQQFDDAKPSLPVVFASARWGSLASFGARQYPGTRRWYGTSGNSFVAVVEFGPKVRAMAVSSGGASGRAGSPHFNDQAELYASGKLREVYFYQSDLAGHIERSYRP